ncbi:glycosyltransferase family 4 protein [Caproicibacterium sp. XB2]|uniref:glycosyltransferase family 4 protein n=1 Tax=Caproicibacterium sp. XB2 TaxID=3388458 RepID=UPI00384E0BAA
MNIAFVTSGYLPVPAVIGGAVESLVDYLIKMNEKYHKANFTVYSMYDERAEREASKQHNCRYKFIKTPDFIKAGDKAIYQIVKTFFKSKNAKQYRYILQRLWFFKKVSADLAVSNYDKLILENHPTIFMVLKKHGNAQRYLGKCYYHLHNEITNDFGCKELMGQVHKIITVSNFISQSISTYLGGLPRKKTVVLRNCVDEKRFGSAAAQKDGKIWREKFGIKSNEIVFLFCGRVTPEKGAKELMTAFCKADVPNTKLIVAGGYFYGSGVKSAYEQKLCYIAESSGNKIVLTGFIPYNDVPGVYAAADVVCIPSVCDDAAPLAVIEPLACGLPLITTLSGGIPEYANDKCALLLPRDGKIVDNLAKGIQYLAENPEARERMGKESLRAAEKLTLDNYYRNFMNILSE